MPGMSDVFRGLKDLNAAYASSRRELISASAEALALSKKAIFALHRDDLALADDLLGRAREKLNDCRDIAKRAGGLVWEGSYRAALEEHAEAALYRRFVEKGELIGVELSDADHETMIGAIADLAGEIQRRQVRLASEGKTEAAVELAVVIEKIVEGLLDMDLEGYLRTKFDQAKNALRRAEEVKYDVSMRREK